jgi:hypothetical protein
MKRATGLSVLVACCLALTVLVGVTITPSPALADGGQGNPPPHQLPGHNDTLPDTLGDPTAPQPEDPTHGYDLFTLESALQVVGTVTR